MTLYGKIASKKKLEYLTEKLYLYKMIKFYPSILREENNQNSRRIVTRSIYLQRSFKRKDKIVRRKTTPNINVTAIIR